MNVVGSLIALTMGLLVFRNRALWGLIIVLTLAVMAVSVVQDRYFLPLLPMMIYGWWQTIRWVNLRLPGRWGNAAFALLFMVGSFINGAKIGEMFIEQRHRNPLTAYKGGKFASIHKVADMLDRHVPADAFIVAPKKTERILTFLARRKVLERGQVNWVDPDKVKVFVLLQSDFDPTVPLQERLGPAIEHVQGPYDRQAWVLYPVK
jgi:hypothetical protein